MSRFVLGSIDEYDLYYFRLKDVIKMLHDFGLLNKTYINIDEFHMDRNSYTNMDSFDLNELDLYQMHEKYRKNMKSSEYQKAFYLSLKIAIEQMKEPMLLVIFPDEKMAKLFKNHEQLYLQIIEKIGEFIKNAKGTSPFAEMSEANKKIYSELQDLLKKNKKSLFEKATSLFSFSKPATTGGRVRSKPKKSHLDKSSKSKSIAQSSRSARRTSRASRQTVKPIKSSISRQHKRSSSKNELPYGFYYVTN